MPSQPTKPRGRLLLVDGRPTFVPSTLTEVGQAKFPGEQPSELPPSLPAKDRRRGRPRKVAATGTWEDDGLLTAVSDIIGDRDEREHSGAEVREALCRFAREFLGHQRFTADRRAILKSLALKPKASVIAGHLRAWQHGVGDRDVRRMDKALRADTRRRVKMVYR